MTQTVPTPQPGRPKVEFIEQDLALWTFATEDHDLQMAEFTYWRGWFGFDEDAMPHEIHGTEWLVRRHSPITPASATP